MSIDEALQERHREGRPPECDFCSAPRPTGTFFRYYHCEVMSCFGLNTGTGEMKHVFDSEAGFCACKACEALIDRSD